MRDAFGGAFMIKLFLVFILIYVFFIALALNYAKAFKVKNKIIDYLETNEVILLKGNTPSYVESTLEEYIGSDIIKGMNYRAEINCSNTNEKQVYCANGIRITSEVSSGTGKNKNIQGVYYNVEVVVNWEFKALNLLLNLNGNNKNQKVLSGNWVISGETRLIVNS